MALSSDHQPLIPSFLYSTSVTSKTPALDKVAGKSNPSFSPHPSSIASKKSFMIPAPSEPGKIEMYSPQFYAVCTFGGILSCGLTHMAVTPLDLIKCNMQIDLAKYKSISSGFGVLLKEQGVKGFFRSAFVLQVLQTASNLEEAKPCNFFVGEEDLLNQQQSDYVDLFASRADVEDLKKKVYEKMIS